MNKARKWPTRVIYMLIALALVLSFSVVALPVSAATSVGTVTVTVSPNTQNWVGAQHTILFNTSSSGALAVGNGIWVDFTGYTTALGGNVPKTYSTGDVTVNGAQVSGGNVNLQTAMALSNDAGTAGTHTVVEILTPVDISAGGPVEIIFNIAADIKNPNADGAATLDVETSSDVTQTTSTAYVIAGSTGGRVSLYNAYDVFVNSYNTITLAEAAAAQYYDIEVSAGTYIEDVTVNVPDLTLESTDGPGTTTIRGTMLIQPAADRCVIGGAAGLGFTFDGGDLKLINIRSGGAGVTNAVDVTISHNTFDTTLTASSNGILVQDGPIEGLTVSNNDFTIVDQYDMGIYCAKESNIKKATISDNTFTAPGYPLDTSAMELCTPDIQLANDDCIISGNTITGAWSGCVIGYGSSAGYGLEDGGGAVLSVLKISGNTFDSCVNGLDMCSAVQTGGDQRVIIVGNTFTDCTYYGFDVDYGSVPITGDGNLDPSDWTVKFNNFSGNTEYGLYNNVGDDLDVSHNWWGDATGPGGEGTGSGDLITTYVTPYIPCLGASVSTADYTDSALNLYCQSTVGVDVVSTDAATAIGVAKYTGNPQGVHEHLASFTALSYSDVYALASDWTGDVVTIKIYDDGVTSSSKISFWSDTTSSWVECYEQGASSGYVWARVRPYTAVYPDRVPVLTDLVGLPFAISTTGVVEPTEPADYDDDSSGVIEIDELLDAISDYIGGVSGADISLLLEVIAAYINETPV